MKEQWEDQNERKKQWEDQRERKEQWEVKKDTNIKIFITSNNLI